MVVVVVVVVVVVNLMLKMSENVVKRSEFCLSQRIALYRRYLFIIIIIIIIVVVVVVVIVIIIIINCRLHEYESQIRFPPSATCMKSRKLASPHAAGQDAADEGLLLLVFMSSR